MFHCNIDMHSLIDRMWFLDALYSLQKENVNIFLLNATHIHSSSSAPLQSISFMQSPLTTSASFVALAIIL